MMTTTPFYRAFEDRYRGSRDVIKTRLTVYLDFVRPLTAQDGGPPKALDLGCGRGEWLELLFENGFDAMGVDLDDGILTASRKQGLKAIQGDALEHLSALPDNSLALVTAFHLVEHLPFEALQMLLSQSLRVLQPGGLLILETPNSENLIVGTSNFYLDPTHQRPIPHLLLSFLTEYHGFFRNKVLRLQESASTATNPSPTLWDVLIGASPDYAVVAQKIAQSEVLAPFESAFGRDFGLSLETLAHRHEVHRREQQERANQRSTQIADELQVVIAELRHVNASLERSEQTIRRLKAHGEHLSAKSAQIEAALETQRGALSVLGDLKASLIEHQQLTESIDHRVHLMTAWRTGVDASVSSAVERLNRLERNGFVGLMKYGIARPLLKASLALGAATLSPFPAIRLRATQWLARKAPGFYERIMLLTESESSDTMEPETATASEATARSQPAVPRGAFRRTKVPNPESLLEKKELASLPRPLEINRFLSPPQTQENERLESVSSLAEMRRGASSVAFVLTLTDRDPAALERSIQSVLRQTDPAWELLLCAPEPLQSKVDDWLDIDWRIRRITGGTQDEVRNLLLASWQSTTEYIGLLSTGDVVDDDLVKHISKRCSALPPCDLVYTDEATLLPDGAIRAPFYKPDWSPEHHQSVNLLGRFLAVRKSLLLNLDIDDAPPGAAREYALSLRLAAMAHSIGHIDEVLYVRRCEAERPAGGFFEAQDLEAARQVLQAHLSHQDPAVEVVAHHPPGALQVSWPIPKDTEVTLLILTNMQERQVPGRGNIVLATNFVKSILEKSTFKGYKIIVVDDGHVPDDLQKLLADHGHRSASYPRDGEFSFANKSNFATSLVSSGVVLLLNDDLEVIVPDWIEALVGHALRPEIAVVGGKLLFPDRSIQHAGISTGLNGSAGHVFMNSASDQLEYGGYASVIRNYGAVTGAVMAYRKELFDQMGGFDEFFRVDYNDIDFCLRCVRAGFRVVFTPHAQLFHFHNSSFKRKHDRNAEREEFLARWHDVVERDPYCGTQLRVISAEQKSEHAA